MLIFNYIIIILALVSVTNLIVWSKISGWIKGYFEIGMLDEPTNKWKIFIKELINCSQCLGIWIGILGAFCCVGMFQTVVLLTIPPIVSLIANKV